jgi:hypothetical protein
MHVMQTVVGRSTFADIYRSDIAYWAGLLVIWELLVILTVLWVVPFVVEAAASAGPVTTSVAGLGAGA